MVKGSTIATITKNVVVVDTETPYESQKYAYSNNYKRKNPITRTQWRRYQRYKKATANDNTFDPKGKQKVVKIAKRLAKERLSLRLIKKNHDENDEMDSDFMDSKPDFDVVCNVVSILPTEYDVVSEVE